MVHRSPFLTIFLFYYLPGQALKLAGKLGLCPIKKGQAGPFDLAWKMKSGMDQKSKKRKVILDGIPEISQRAASTGSEDQVDTLTYTKGVPT
jgi:hypothetical protein